ncbi:MAG: hypothetical protein IJG15_00005 [Lachnospiraceae bacterium]|nr:hypothetical protein [Lachnospiraceae bacterium]
MIQFERAEKALEQIQQVESAIRSDGEAISKIRSGFGGDFTGKERILESLRVQMDRMASLGDTAQSFGSGLESVLQLYSTTEQALLEGGTQNGGSYADAAWYGTDSSSHGKKPGGSDGQAAGSIAGAGIIAAGVLGAAAQGRGASTDELLTDTDAGTAPAPAEIETEAESPQPVTVPDVEMVHPAMPVDPEKLIEIASEDSDWEEFLSLFPEEIVEIFPEEVLDYLHDIFDLLKENPIPFGLVRFLDTDDLISCEVWASFITAVMWYLDRKNGASAPEDFTVEPAGDTDLPEEPEDIPAEETEDSAGEEMETFMEEDTAAGQKESTGTETDMTQEHMPESTQAQEPIAESAPAELPEAGNSAGGKSPGGGHSGGGSAGGSVPTDPGIDTAIPDPGSAATDATGDYLTSLLGDQDLPAAEVSGWAEKVMADWGRSAADRLGRAGQGAGRAAGSGMTAMHAASSAHTSPVARTARSMVYAAVIDAGIEMAMHGAGAVSSVIGGGKADLFEELESTEII